MIRTLVTIIFATVVTNSASALIGGPWDDNDHAGRAGAGNYQAFLTGKNLTGMMRSADLGQSTFKQEATSTTSDTTGGGLFGLGALTTSTTTVVTATNQTIIYYRGVIFEGDAAIATDIGSGNIFGTGATQESNTQGILDAGEITTGGQLNANVSFRGKFTTAGKTRFKGKGKVSVYGVTVSRFVDRFNTLSGITQPTVQVEGTAEAVTATTHIFAQLAKFSGDLSLTATVPTISNTEEQVISLNGGNLIAEGTSIDVTGGSVEYTVFEEDKAVTSIDGTFPDSVTDITIKVFGSRTSIVPEQAELVE